MKGKTRQPSAPGMWSWSNTLCTDATHKLSPEMQHFPCRTNEAAGAGSRNSPAEKASWEAEAGANGAASSTAYSQRVACPETCRGSLGFTQGDVTRLLPTALPGIPLCFHWDPARQIRECRVEGISGGLPHLLKDWANYRSICLSTVTSAGASSKRLRGEAKKKVHYEGASSLFWSHRLRGDAEMLHVPHPVFSL